MGIGSFYNAKGVLVGQAMGLYAPENTPLPADTLALFDESTWATTKVDTGTNTGGTLTLSMAKGPLSSIGTVTTANIAQAATGSAVAAAITAALNAVGLFSLVPSVAGTGAVGTPWTIALLGPGGAEVVITGAGALTGGASVNPNVVPPLWTPMGATEQGWQSNYSPTTQNVVIEEQQTPVGRNVTDATYEFVANLSEDTMDNLALALSAARTITAPDTTHFGVDELALQETLPVLAVALETKNRRGFPRRYYIPGATCAVNVGQTFARARGQRLVPVTFSSVCDVSAIKIRSITANHT